MKSSGMAPRTANAFPNCTLALLGQFRHRGVGFPLDRRGTEIVFGSRTAWPFPDLKIRALLMNSPLYHHEAKLVR
jgi:hypothetical protein